MALQSQSNLNMAFCSRSWNVGGMVTDDTGQCRRARHILALQWPKITLCSALLTASTTRLFSQIARETSAVVNALNGSSNKRLKRVRDTMVKMYGYRLSLCSLRVTRWNSMQECLLRCFTCSQRCRCWHDSRTATKMLPVRCPCSCKMTYGMI